MTNLLNRVLYQGSRIFDKIRGKLDIRAIEVLIDEELEKHFKPNKKTILYVAPKYNYGHKHWGLSNWHYHFYRTLLNMDYSLICFNFDRIEPVYGSGKMSQMLREAVYCYHPDILLYCFRYDTFDHEVWKEISNELSTKTIIFLSDDHFQYEETRPVWELFNLVVTMDKKGYEKRKKEAFNDVFFFPPACDSSLYKILNLPKIYDISFVGQCYGRRQKFIDTLKRNGINIATFGYGWKNSDRVSQADLIKIYNQSKISLNLSFASKGNRIQIKGRDFDVPRCGSLLLTKDTEEIAEYYIPGKEIVTYQDANDAAEKIKYYLRNEDEREKIAKNGYERTLKEHIWEKRFSDLFEFAFK